MPIMNCHTVLSCYFQMQAQDSLGIAAFPGTADSSWSSKAHIPVKTIITNPVNLHKVMTTLYLGK